LHRRLDDIRLDLRSTRDPDKFSFRLFLHSSSRTVCRYTKTSRV
jgi:hypothetical protein